MDQHNMVPKRPPPNQGLQLRPRSGPLHRPNISPARGPNMAEVHYLHVTTSPVGSSQVYIHFRTSHPVSFPSRSDSATAFFHARNISFIGELEICTVRNDTRNQASRAQDAHAEQAQYHTDDGSVWYVVWSESSTTRAKACLEFCTARGPQRRTLPCIGVGAVALSP